ncbi:MAG TPA: POTRA domain-containing protein [Terriglobales bacterium]|nr:POTRA domain-containing protein [Terriglobales bacterium]
MKIRCEANLSIMRLLVVVLFVVVTGAWAQLAVQGPQSIYDGQTVSAIDLIGNPHRDLEYFRPLVVQKVGEPYSQANVEASIKALERTGQFPKIQLQVVPDPSGLRLNFLLEPAYYLGMVDFPEAAKLFSYTRLLQVADLPDEDPYDQARVAIAEQALQNFLRHNGYFQALVQNNIDIDDAHQLANLTFSAKLGKQARVADVTIQGTEPAENVRLLHSLRSLRTRFTGGLLKPGKPYSRERITAALAAIRRTLAQQHRLASHVEEIPPQYHAETNRVDVSFKVDLGPVVTVRATGARPSALPFMSGREMKKLIPIYSEGAIDHDLVEEGQQNLTDYFQKKGYFKVQVTTTFQQHPDRILLVYEIDKGSKYRVERIEFQGNHAISEKDLLAAVVVKKSHLWWHGSLSQKLLHQSATNLEALYRDRGYEEAKVSSQSLDHESKIDAVFKIEEGAQTLVSNVEVTGNDNIPAGQLAPAGFQLRSGAGFSPRQLADDRNRISATYLNRGYLNVEVKATVKRNPSDPHRVDVTYAIDEHQMVRVGDVIYLGQRRTRLSLIRKTAKVTTEAPMSRGELLEAESRLYDLNIFDWSSVGPRKPITDQTEESALVKVHEAKRNEVTYGFGFEVSHRGGNIPTGTVAVPGGPPVELNGYQIAPSQATFASPRGSVEIERHNMRGLAETASASILVSRLDQRALSTYAQPHFVGSQWSSLTSLSAERTTENPLFGATLGDASFQLERLLSRKNNTRFQIRYDFNKTVLSHLLVPELVLPQDRNVHLSTVSGTLLRDTRDKPLDAHRGSLSVLTLGITPTSLGSSANFGRLLSQYAFYKPFRSVVFANSVRLGFVKSFAGSFVPTSELFFSGGGTSLRGFPIDEAGPQRLVPFCNVLTGLTGCVNVTVPVGGRQLFILNSEVRFPLGIMKALGGVLFYDGGNVYSAVNFNNFVNNYTNTVGVGLRYATPIGPIRVDIGRNLNPVPGLTPTQYYITLGQAF